MTKRLFLIIGILLMCMPSGCRRAEAPQSKHPAKTQAAGAVRSKLDVSAFRRDFAAAMPSPETSAVALDPGTGRVLAMHNRDTALLRSFPIGSAFKPVTAVAAVESGAAQPSFASECKGKLALHGEEFKCWLASGHGRVTMQQALAQSCNVYFYRLGTMVKARRLAHQAESFGFGRRPGFLRGEDALLESAGAVPSKTDPAFVSRFAAGDTVELLASPMQMAVYAAALANRGTVVRPSDKGDAAPAGKTGAPRGIAIAVEGMKLCATPEGTCHALAKLPKPAAGKTGTARSLAGPQTHAWFIGFYPADKPEIAIAVFVPRGRGETDAAPAAFNIFLAFDKNSSFK